LKINEKNLVFGGLVWACFFSRDWFGGVGGGLGLVV